LKFAYPMMNAVLDTDSDKINCLIIENQRFLCTILEDLYGQLHGMEGKAVISKNEKILSVDKHVELLLQFISFDLNKKSLLTRISAELERNAVTGDTYARTLELMSELEAYLTDLAFDYRCDLSFPKINIGAILKAVGVEVNSNYSSLGEKIIDYMELVTEFEREKLFILVNLRSFVSDTEIRLFYETVLSHQYHVLMIESSEHAKIALEKRFIIDSDLCEIV